MAVSFSSGHVEVYIEESFMVEEDSLFFFEKKKEGNTMTGTAGPPISSFRLLSLYPYLSLGSSWGSRSVCLHAWVSLACLVMCSTGSDNWEELPDAIPFF